MQPVEVGDHSPMELVARLCPTMGKWGTVPKATKPFPCVGGANRGATNPHCAPDSWRQFPAVSIPPFSQGHAGCLHVAILPIPGPEPSQSLSTRGLKPVLLRQSSELEQAHSLKRKDSATAANPAASPAGVWLSRSCRGRRRLPRDAHRNAKHPTVHIRLAWLR